MNWPADAVQAIKVVAETRCRVGESPVWNARSQSLLWCDVWEGKIFELDTRSGELKAHDLGEQVGSFGLTDDGRLVVALLSGVHLYCPETRGLSPLADPEPGRATAFPGDRLNDGKVGPDGAFWVGSLHKSGPTAALYRVTGDGVVERKADGLGTSNGLAFSADCRLMFHSDSKQGWIDRYRFDPRSGALSERTRIARLDSAAGMPDGGATDLADQYWSAGVSAGRLNCFDFEGRLLQTIELPVDRPTMVCFGGDDMQTLYVTSIRRPEAATKLCGNVLSLRVETPGTPVAAFRVAR